MNKEKINKAKKIRRHKRTRAKVIGSASRPRLSVFRSNKELYLQLIDDSRGLTLASASNKELTKSKKTKIEQAFESGKSLAKKALAKNIKKAVFDRGCYKYHGRTEAAASGAREGGLEF